MTHYFIVRNLMREQQNIWLGLIFILLLQCAACDSSQRQSTLGQAQGKRATTETATLSPPTLQQVQDKNTTATNTPTIVPTDTPRPVEPAARRSDFISTITPLPSATACAHEAQFVADVTIPDGTELEPGEAFVKTWQVRNSGNCDWETGFQLALAQGAAMGGPSSVSVSATLAGDVVNVSVPLTAPQSYGTHQGQWTLHTPQGQGFGEQVFVQIVVPLDQAPAALAPQEQVPARKASDGERLALLNYFAWYDADGWDDCNISAGDRPAQPYGSDDPAAIARHVQMALEAGADGFTQQWFTPGDRTDRNFETLLAQSQGTGLRSTVVFLRHIWHGGPASQADVVAALRYLLERYSTHPNFLRYQGQPVIFITDLYRVPLAAGQTPQQAWASIRAQVDPQSQTWWIGEGLDPTYLAVFDGLWVYKITHAAYPQAYLKASQWANAARQWESRLWVATISPGWDDLRSGCRSDVRAPSHVHQQARQEGAFYQATFDAALESKPDWLWISSFNEWVEGTYIEASAFYGDFYLHKTRELIAAFKGR